MRLFTIPGAFAFALALALLAGTAQAHTARALHHHRHHRPAIDHSGRVQVGKASYYGVHRAGATTASGKPLAPDKLTAASKTLPLGAVARVTNRKTGKSVAVKITDRGPYAKHRILDVSPKAARILGMKKDGVAEVKVQPLHLPPRQLASR